jgi:hypothetical protein
MMRRVKRVFSAQVFIHSFELRRKKQRVVGLELLGFRIRCTLYGRNCVYGTAINCMAFWRLGPGKTRDLDY